MLFYTIGQSRIFLAMLYAGLIVGLYAVLDRLARRLFRAGRILSAVMDVLLGLVAAAIVLTALLSSSDGELRLYALMGALCGWLIFTATLAPLTEALLLSSARLIRRIFLRLGRLTAVKKLLK